MRKIKLSQNKIAIVDDEDYEMLIKHKWYANKLKHKWYVNTNVRIANKRTVIRMHRMILKPNTNVQVDHINGNSLDNRKDNLRLCNNAENMRNRDKPRNNTSGYKGVTWNKDMKKWQAQIMVNYINIILGYYKDIKKAARVYNEAALKYFGEYAYLNKRRNKKEETR